jgi:hypothetical protein
MGESCVGGANLGTGRDKTKARARVFMIVTRSDRGPHMGRDFTEPFAFRTRIAFADPAYSR